MIYHFCDYNQIYKQNKNRQWTIKFQNFNNILKLNLLKINFKLKKSISETKIFFKKNILNFEIK